MPSDRSLIEREMQHVELRPFTLDGFHRHRERKQRNRRIRAGVVALVVAAVGVAMLVRAFPSGPVPADDPSSPFLGIWVAIDGDGSHHRMTIRTSREGAVEILAHDDVGSFCSPASSTMTGTGRFEDTGKLVIPSPVLTCDDLSDPEAPTGGPAVQERLRNLAFVHRPETDSLTDPFGTVWERAGTDATSGAMWPQSTLRQARKAQRLADTGDPRYAWQVDPKLRRWQAGLDEAHGDPTIVTRFLQEQLGWEEFRYNPIPEDGFGDGVDTNVVYIRCAPGKTNPLYPNDPEGRTCAPTIDETHYETVSLDLAQPVRQDRSGIWVVTRWTRVTPFEQGVPPSEAETTALLEAFLQARIDGEGAEEYADVPDAGSPTEEVPLLYATTTGAPYERSEFEVVEGSAWPDGWMRFRVRLLAEGGTTVVKQLFLVNRDGRDRLRLLYVFDPADTAPTAENGRVVPVQYEFLDGDVRFSAGWPWSADRTELQGPRIMTLVDDGRHDARIALVADPWLLADSCRDGPTPADIQALAPSIRSDPDLEATAPVMARVGGIPALRMDVVTTDGPMCAQFGYPPVVDGVRVDRWTRVRLYLLDLPGGSSGSLAIAITAPKQRFEPVMEEAVAPILDSFEFHAR